VVWNAIGERAAQYGVHSRTRAQRDIYRACAEELSEPREAFALRLGRSGALVAIGYDICLDVVSRPEAFARACTRSSWRATFSTRSERPDPVSPRSTVS
jgi:hypothetical protein